MHTQSTFITPKFLDVVHTIAPALLVLALALLLPLLAVSSLSFSNDVLSYLPSPHPPAQDGVLLSALSPSSF